MMSFKIHVKFNMRIIYIHLSGAVILAILLTFKCKILNYKKNLASQIYIKIDVVLTLPCDEEAFLA